MAVTKVELIRADVMLPDGSIFTGEDLENMATMDIRYKYEPEERILYALIETE